MRLKKRLNVIYIVGGVLICVAIVISQTQIGVLSFEQLFPPENQALMGLHKLTNTEKEELRSHVEKLISIALSYRSTKKDGATYYGIGGGHWIKKNIERGSFILLEDASLWQIDPLEKIDAMLWLPISNITVIQSSKGSMGYDYLLINTDDGEKAHAKYMGKQ